MKIKGQEYSFENLTGSTLNEKIANLQTDLKNCARKVSMFDLYRIRYVVDDISDYNAILNQLLPGESLIIRAQGNTEHPAGQIVIRVSETEYQTIEPFQIGSYYPSDFEQIDDTPNYKLTYSFIDYYPSSTEEPVKVGSSTDVKDKLYIEFSTPENADVYYQLGDGFASPIGSDPITFTAKSTKPIIKFFLRNAENDEYEEIIVPFTLSYTDTSYTIQLKEAVTAPANLYVAVK